MTVAVLPQVQTARPTLLIFSGADWCPWCQKLEHDVLATGEFKNWAQDHVRIERIDFLRHTIQSPETVGQNDHLRHAYQVENLPTLILIDYHGQELGRLEYSPGPARHYIAQLQRILNRH